MIRKAYTELITMYDYFIASPFLFCHQVRKTTLRSKRILSLLKPLSIPRRLAAFVESMLTVNDIGDVFCLERWNSIPGRTKQSHELV